jgi:hypothetical protein
MTWLSAGWGEGTTPLKKLLFTANKSISTSVETRNTTEHNNISVFSDAIKFLTIRAVIAN